MNPLQDPTIPFNSQGVVVNGPGGPALASLGIPPAPAITVPSNPGVKKTSVVTSELAANATKNNSEFLNQIGSQLNIAQEKALQIKATLDAMAKKEEADKLASTKPQSEVDKLIGEVGGVSTGNIKQPDFRNPAILENETKLANEKAELAKLRITMDTRSSSIIQNIEREYDSLIEEQRQMNKAFEGGIVTEGFRSGRSRYAPVLQSGIISSTINSGIRALSNLQVKKQGLILQAENARDERNFKLLNDSIQEYRESVKEERNIAQKTYENAINASQEAREQLKFEREQAEKTAGFLAPKVTSLMTGELEADFKIIEDFASENSIDPNLLYSSVEKHKQEIQKLYGKNGDKVLSTTTRVVGGIKYADVVYRNTDGELYTDTVTLGRSSDGDSDGTGIVQPDVSWQEYLRVAQDELQMSLSPNSALFKELKDQYDKEFPVTGSTKFTSTEIKKLEQKGLLSASRSTQLDFLYGDTEGGITEGDLDSVDFGQ